MIIRSIFISRMKSWDVPLFDQEVVKAVTVGVWEFLRLTFSSSAALPLIRSLLSLAKCWIA